MPIRVYFFIAFYVFFFFLFSGDNTLPKAIDILMRCYQGFFVAINFIIRMLVLRAFVIILFFFFRCPMLTFNDLPHFLPLLYLIIDCDLHTRAHTLSLSFALSLLLSLSLSPSPYFSLQLSLAFPIPFDRPVTLSLPLLLGSNNSRFDRSRYIYSGINGSDIVDNEHFVSLQTTIHLSRNGGVHKRNA